MFGKLRAQMQTLIRVNMVFIRDKYNMNILVIRDIQYDKTMSATTNLLSKISLHVRGPTYISTFTPKKLNLSNCTH